MPDTGKIDEFLYEVINTGEDEGLSEASGMYHSSDGKNILVMVEFLDEGNLNRYINSIRMLGGEIIRRDRIQPILVVRASKDTIYRITDIPGVYKIWYDAKVRRM